MTWTVGVIEFGETVFELGAIEGSTSAEDTTNTGLATPFLTTNALEVHSVAWIPTGGVVGDGPLRLGIADYFDDGDGITFATVPWISYVDIASTSDSGGAYVEYELDTPAALADATEYVLVLQNEDVPAGFVNMNLALTDTETYTGAIAAPGSAGVSFRATSGSSSYASTGAFSILFKLRGIA